jgi:hypothetical protein
MAKISYTHTDGSTYDITRDSDAGGWLQGHIAAPYSELVSAFGSPNSYGPGGKVQAEWQLKINGTLVTIYDYKEEVPAQRVRDWHIGGTEKNAAAVVQRAFEAYRHSRSGRK